jgi:hypothetical protein
MNHIDGYSSIRKKGIKGKLMVENMDGFNGRMKYEKNK